MLLLHLLSNLNCNTVCITNVYQNISLQDYATLDSQILFAAISIYNFVYLASIHQNCLYKVFLLIVERSIISQYNNKPYCLLVESKFTIFNFLFAFLFFSASKSYQNITLELFVTNHMICVVHRFKISKKKTFQLKSQAYLACVFRGQSIAVQFNSIKCVC